MAYGMFRLGERVEDRRLMFPRRSDRLALPWLPLPRARPAAPSAKVSERTSRGHRTPRAASSGVPCSHRCRPPHVIFPRPARRAAGQLARQPLNGGPTSILTPLLDYIPDGDADVLVVLARVRLRGLAPAPIEQGLDGGHARGRWGEFPAKPFGTTPADLSRWRGAGTTGTTYPSRRCGRPLLVSCWCPALQPIRRPELLAAGGIRSGNPAGKRDRPWAEPPGRCPD